MNGENESLEPTTYDTGLTDLRASVPSMNLALEWEDIALRADGDASAIMKEVERGLVQAANRVLKARLNDVDALFGDEPIDIERWTAWCYALETELIKVLRHVVAGLPDQRKPSALDAHGLRFQKHKFIQQDNEFYPWDRVLAEIERLCSEGAASTWGDMPEDERPRLEKPRNPRAPHQGNKSWIVEAYAIERPGQKSDLAARLKVCTLYEEVHDLTIDESTIRRMLDEK